MTAFLVALLILDGVVLAVAVLLQAGQGGGLASTFGGAASTDSFVGGRQAATLLTKASWWTGGIFLGLSFILQLASGSARQPRSVLEGQFEQPAPLAPLPLNAPSPSEPGTPAAPAPAPPGQRPAR
jgi:preprotein translocase subunit SecG